MLRRGFFTSPAVNVMLFQASAEKSDPVCDTQIATNRPNAVSADSPGTMSPRPRRVQRLPKLSATAVVIPAKQQTDEDQRRAARRSSRS